MLADELQTDLIQVGAVVTTVAFCDMNNTFFRFVLAIK